MQYFGDQCTYECRTDLCSNHGICDTDTQPYVDANGEANSAGPCECDGYFHGYYCTADIRSPTCSDAVANSQETDVDCGGPDCPECANGQSCSGESDCVSGYCYGGVCAETEPPVFLSGFPVADVITASSIRVKFKLDEPGNVYIVLVPDSDADPSVAEVKSGQAAGGGAPVAWGVKWVSAGNVGRTYTFSGLNELTDFKVVLVAEDVYENEQLSVTSFFASTVADTTPPAWLNSYPSLSGVKQQSATVRAAMDEAGIAYCVVLEGGSPAPTSEQVSLGKDASGAAALAAASVVLSPAGVVGSMAVSGLVESTDYDIYVVGEDSAATSNFQGTPTLLSLATEADVTPPTWVAGYPQIAEFAYHSVTISARTSESGSIFAVVVPSGAAAPSASDVESGAAAGGEPAVAAGSAAATTDTAVTFSISDLPDDTSLTAYVVARDNSASQNLMSEATPLSFTTVEATCSDGDSNGGESGVDCGGGVCPACSVGESCASSSDCAAHLYCDGSCSQCDASCDGCNGAGAAACHSCADGYFDNDGICTQCTVCSDEEWEETSCRAADDQSQDRVCLSCQENNCESGCADTTGVCDACAAGFYRAGTQCFPCAECGVNEWMLQDCQDSGDESANRVCQACSDRNCASECADGTGICDSCAAGYYRSGDDCIACTPECDANSWQEYDCQDGGDESQNRVCHSCSSNNCAAECADETGECISCAVEHYRSGDACVPCDSTCETNEWEEFGCQDGSETQNRVCKSCASENCAGECADGSGICSSCAEEHYRDGTACVACSDECGENEWELHACQDATNGGSGETQDRVCNSCASGNCAAECSDDTGVCIACADEHRRVGDECVACTQPCAADEYEVFGCQEGSEDQDRECRSCGDTCASGCADGTGVCDACAADHYRVGDACVPCTSECGVNEWEEFSCQQNEETQNRVCHSCADGNCAGECADGTGICAACASEFHRVGDNCVACEPPCATNFWEERSCQEGGEFQNRVCHSCSENNCAAECADDTGVCNACASEHYRDGSECVSCESPCGTDEYEVFSCQDVSNGGSGEHQNRVCSSCSSNRCAGECHDDTGLCLECESGTFDSGGTEPPSGSCTPCANVGCAENEYQATSCSPTTDNTCAVCHEGCSGCVGPTAEDCVSCATGFRDCGGGVCGESLCEAGQNCSDESDCDSSVCTAGTCQAHTCTDGVRNGQETDTDCGGVDCDPCGSGAQCLGHHDCEYGTWCDARDTGLCTTCSSACASCTGGTSSDCTTCSPAYYRESDRCVLCSEHLGDSLNDGDHCQAGNYEATECQEGGVETVNRICADCGDSCDHTCSDGSGICDACAAGYYRDGTACVACDAPCDENEWMEFDCQEGSESQNRVCHSCMDGNCDGECADGSGICDACAAEYHRVGDKCLACSTPCSASEWEAVGCQEGNEEQDRDCRPCSSTCLAGCADDTGVCEACAAEHYRDGDNCVPCAAGCGVNEWEQQSCQEGGDEASNRICRSCADHNCEGECSDGAGVCDACSTEHYRVGSECVSCTPSCTENEWEQFSCQDGTNGGSGEPQNRVCHSCAANNCRGECADDTGVCDSCADEYHRFEQECVACSPECGSNEWEQVGCQGSGDERQDRICLSCEANNCAGECSDATGVCDACADGFYRSGADCVACAEECGPNEWQVHDCQEGSEAQDRVCQSCAENQCAGECADATGTCDECAPEFYRSGTLCIACDAPCGVNEWQESECQGGTEEQNRVCHSCAQNNCAAECDDGTGVCDACAPGFFRDGDECARCAPPCEENDWEQFSCQDSTNGGAGETQNRVCRSCSSGNCAGECADDSGVCFSCAAGYFRSGTDCVACASECEPNEWQEYDCQGGGDEYQDRVCRACSTGNCAGECNDGNGRCHECADGYYRLGDACVACAAPCSENEWEAISCAESHDRVCNSCGDGNCAAECADATGVCDTCAAEHYRSGEDCLPCSPSCAQNEWEQFGCQDGSEGQNRVCRSCSDGNCEAECADTTGVCENCSAEHYRVGDSCEACAAHCGENEWQEFDCGAGGADETQDRVCHSCAARNCAGECDDATGRCHVCAAEHYRVGDDCMACAAPCAENEWEEVQCTEATNRVCNSCAAGNCEGECADGTGICLACADGYFDSTGSNPPEGQCQQCSTAGCDDGEYQASVCSPTSNNSCAACDEACDGCTTSGAAACVDCAVGFRDCGDGVCVSSLCNAGETCQEASDCTSHVCRDLQCLEATCNDGVRNGDETDIDCGGNICEACGTGAACSTTEDCTPGTFCPAEGVCMACDRACDECYGPGSDGCTSCASSYFRDGDTCTLCAEHAADTGDHCEPGRYEVSTCQAGGDETLDRICADCGASCLDTCADGSGVCDSCAEEFHRIDDACVPCTASCAPNEWMLVDCQDDSHGGAGETQDRQCRSCADENCAGECADFTGVCVECAAGFYRDGQACVACAAPCGDNEWEVVSCEESQDRVCASCSENNCAAECEDLTGYCDSCASESHRVGPECVPCAPACAENEYEVVNCQDSDYGTGETQDRVCAACSENHCAGECSDVTGICDACAEEYHRFDDECLPCSSPCSDNQFEEWSCQDDTNGGWGERQNRVCRECSDRHCAAECSDDFGVCDNCADGYFRLGNNCEQCRPPCGEGEWESASCTEEHDRVCATCAANNCAGECSDGSGVCNRCAVGSFRVDDACELCSAPCAVNEWQQMACQHEGNERQDRVCLDCSDNNCTGECADGSGVCNTCAAGFYRETDGGACVSCSSECSENEWQVFDCQEGGELQDRVCSACADLNCAGECADSTGRCEACADGFFDTGGPSSPTGVCMACSEDDCAHGEYQSSVCSPTTDNTCSSCDVACDGCLSSGSAACLACADGYRDCGDGECTSDLCDVGAACASPSDCTSSVCGEDGSCIAPTCGDGVLNGDESDVDCGGSSCGACPFGSACRSARNDCSAETWCNGDICAACHHSCNGCSGPTAQDCSVCSDTHYRDGDTCVLCSEHQWESEGEHCAAGRYVVTECQADGNESTNRVCASCGPSCLSTCADETGRCDACAPGYYRSGDECVRCVEYCPWNHWEIQGCQEGGDETLNRECGSCAEFNCEGNCVHDTGLCEACAAGYYDAGGTVPPSGLCVECAPAECPSGSYLATSCSSTTDNTCAQCDDTCSECDGPLHTDCTACAPGLRDCGDGVCSAELCETDSSCADESDCLSGVCGEAGTCEAPSCIDGVHNGDEAGIDCGGSACSGCAAGVTCALPGDCGSGVCSDSTCQAPTCNDGTRNGDESDVDCGGATCSVCPDEAACSIPDDCGSGVCASSLCQAPTCSDGVQNGAETAVDCGGADCSACDTGAPCTTSSDCISSVCVAEACAAPTCDDGVRNGDEGDIDCGGSACSSLCAAGKSCLADEDCMAGYSCPDDNSYCTDLEEPQLVTGMPQVTFVQGRSFGVTFAFSEAGVVYYVVAETGASQSNQPLGERPTVEQVQAGVASEGVDVVDSGILEFEGGEEVTFEVDGLAYSTPYDVWFVAEDNLIPSNVGTEALRLVVISDDPPSCYDEELNGEETDLDCGGPICDACSVHAQCVQHWDCESGRCTNGHCTLTAPHMTGVLDDDAGELHVTISGGADATAVSGAFIVATYSEEIDPTCEAGRSVLAAAATNGEGSDGESNTNSTESGWVYGDDEVSVAVGTSAVLITARTSGTIKAVICADDAGDAPVGSFDIGLMHTGGNNQPSAQQTGTGFNTAGGDGDGAFETVPLVIGMASFVCCAACFVHWRKNQKEDDDDKDMDTDSDCGDKNVVVRIGVDVGSDSDERDDAESIGDGYRSPKEGDSMLGSPADAIRSPDLLDDDIIPSATKVKGRSAWKVGRRARSSDKKKHKRRGTKENRSPGDRMVELSIANWSPTADNTKSDQTRSAKKATPLASFGGSRQIRVRDKHGGFKWVSPAGRSTNVPRLRMMGESLSSGSSSRTPSMKATSISTPSPVSSAGARSGKSRAARRRGLAVDGNIAPLGGSFTSRNRSHHTQAVFGRSPGLTWAERDGSEGIAEPTDAAHAPTDSTSDIASAYNAAVAAAETAAAAGREREARARGRRGSHAVTESTLTRTSPHVVHIATPPAPGTIRSIDTRLQAASPASSGLTDFAPGRARGAASGPSGTPVARRPTIAEELSASDSPKLDVDALPSPVKKAYRQIVEEEEGSAFQSGNRLARSPAEARASGGAGSHSQRRSKLAPKGSRVARVSETVPGRTIIPGQLGTPEQARGATARPQR